MYNPHANPIARLNKLCNSVTVLYLLRDTISSSVPRWFWSPPSVIIPANQAAALTYLSPLLPDRRDLLKHREILLHTELNVTKCGLRRRLRLYAVTEQATCPLRHLWHPRQESSVWGPHRRRAILLFSFTMEYRMIMPRTAFPMRILINTTSSNFSVPPPQPRESREKELTYQEPPTNNATLRPCLAFPQPQNLPTFTCKCRC